MLYCINPDCSQRENPDNCAVCQNCKTPLILQNRYIIKQPLQVDKYRYTEIFEIEDLLDNNKLKILKSLKQVTPKLLRLFEQEASILISLRHPGLPVGEILFPLVLNTGRQLRCLVMEKIPGENLQNWLSRNHYVKSYKTVINWLKQLTQILQFVHDNQFFHRDIKPANIMLCPNGKLVLIDFGTARQLTQTVINNQEITVIISPGYTAPEQCEGHAVLQSDFYALGQTCVYLLTGNNPTKADHKSHNWYNNIKDKQTPKRLIELIQTMTNSHPHRRPATTQVILNKISQIETNSQIQWRKILLIGACGALVILGTKWLYKAVTTLRTCDYIEGDHLSCGEESLIPQSFWQSNQPPATKQLAIDEYRSKNFAEAARLFEIAFNKETDPETLIYWNNAKIQTQFPGSKIHTIAAVVPLERSTNVGLEILRGIAQAQTELLNKQPSLPLRIIIADDSNRDNSKAGNNARKVAQNLVKYEDLLGVLGHYSSDTTKQALPIYGLAQIVLISGSSTSTNLKSPFFFRTIPSDRISAQKIAGFLFSQFKQPKVAIFLSEESEYTQSLSKAFREEVKSLQGKVLDHQSSFNLATDSFDAEKALNQAQNQGATAILLIPDAGVGLYNAIPHAIQVIEANVNGLQIVVGDSLNRSDLLTPSKVISSPAIEQTVWSIAWHPINNINSPFAQQAKTIWRIDDKTFSSNTKITWRTATNYDAVMVISKAIAQKPTRLGIQQILADKNFAVTGATGIIQFEGSDRQNATVTILSIRRKCNSSDFVFVPGDRPLKCQ
ncbi:bifunctional serine/threonine-protein kinase/ABC transporter substrate-binding protein [Nostoc sp. FACHB-190]|uniref:bifunctional serine/threonine-protein kinase/ABC transporter substrate-binding protein n=1 Tax=Nostoc sp. FACHB-190 TaxID=2692838 RepID=UPI00168295BF|nr:bifunctional serine/threonine-protein kinase/ABC transporter substrate-binding protein [Nostoc sp. FACHB-190]MBD2300814.1 protein kinase [Nostoc sp. FACHB-190]